MVNHVRTLLLNETQASLRAAGYRYGEPWYVSPSFDSLSVPAGLVPFRTAVFFLTSSLTDRVNRVGAIMPIVKAPDLSGLFSVLDTRETVPENSGTCVSVREIFDKAKLASNGFEGRILSVAGSSPSLFSRIDDGRLGNAVEDLRKLAMGSFESSVRVGASILAYCMQMEAVRIGASRG